MNVCSLSRFCKGSVHNAKYAAPSVAWVFKATRLFRLVAMRRSLEVRSLAAQKSGSLLGFRLLRGDGTKPSLANLFPRFGRTTVTTVCFGMTVAKMFFRSQALKVFGAVIRFVAIDMMHLLVRVKRLQPALRHCTVHQIVAAAQSKVAVVAQCRCVRLELSENFSAARNCIKVVKESVMDSIYLNADHAVPVGG